MTLDKGDKEETGGALQVESLKGVKTFCTSNVMNCV